MKNPSEMNKEEMDYAIAELHIAKPSEIPGHIDFFDLIEITGWWNYKSLTDDGNLFGWYPRAMTLSISDAWELIEEAESEDIDFEMHNIIPGSDSVVYEIVLNDCANNKQYYANDVTVAYAICRVYLEWKYQRSSNDQQIQ